MATRSLRPTLRMPSLAKLGAVLLAVLLVFHFFDQLARVFLIAYAAAIVAVASNLIVRKLPLERRWVVAEVEADELPADALEPSAQRQHLLTLRCVDDDAEPDESIQVVWEIEPGARAFERSALPDPGFVAKCRRRGRLDDRPDRSSPTPSDRAYGAHSAQSSLSDASGRLVVQAIRVKL